VTVKAGMAHPGHIFDIDEISGVGAQKTIDELLKTGCIKKHGVDLAKAKSKAKKIVKAKTKAKPRSKAKARKSKVAPTQGGAKRK